jgi:hypothetical protein
MQFSPAKNGGSILVCLEICQIVFVECDWVLTLEPLKELMAISFHDIVPGGSRFLRLCAWGHLVARV